VLLSAYFAVAVASVSSAGAQTLDLSDPNDALMATRKVHCSLTDNKPTVLTWTGKVYSHIQGEPDRHLFNIEGFNNRNCKTYQDDIRGYGFRIVAREIVLYLDPETNKILRTWDNPWTGKKVRVIHTSNDPMSFPFPFYALDENKMPHEFEGTFRDGKVWTTAEKILFYKNPLGGNYQKYVGGMYHASEVFYLFMGEEELLDATNDEVMDLTLTYSRVAPWMPWMQMGGRQGIMYFHAAGQKIANFGGLSDRMKQEVATYYPIYADPPSLDDFRPMVNSWSVFKQVIDRERKSE
jgi:hypothetical protein